MRRAPMSSLGVWVLLAGLAGSTGCTHNHYYGTVPYSISPYSTASADVPLGAVCEVPTRVVQAPLRPLVVSNAPRPSRVVISEPRGEGGSRLAWKRSDPDDLTSTRVEGALDFDETISR